MPMNCIVTALYQYNSRQKHVKNEYPVFKHRRNSTLNISEIVSICKYRALKTSTKFRNLMKMNEFLGQIGSEYGCT
jgi:hypothetical protein